MYSTATESNEFYLSPRHRNTVLAALLLASFVGTADVFVVIAVIPAVETAFGVGLEHAQFIATGYTLAYACTLVTGGRLGDLAGRKRVFLVGTVSFGLASLACAGAWSLWALVGARIVQGLAAGAMLPQVLAIIRGTFPAAAQPRAVSRYGVTLGVATVCGQPIAGLLLTVDPLGIGWRAVFLVDAASAVVVAATAALVVPATRAAASTRLPLVSPVLFAVGSASLLVSSATGAARGWSLAHGIGIAFGLAVSTVFVLRELRLSARAAPTLLPAAALRNPAFRLGVLTVFTYYSGTAALNMLLSYFLQSGLHRDALTAGLQFAPLGIGFMIGSLVAGRVVAVRRWPLPVLGALLMASTRIVMLVALTNAGIGGLVLLELSLLTTGIAQGSIVAPLIAAILSRAAAEEAGAVSGVVMTTSNAAVAFGVASIGGVFLAATARWDSVTGFALALSVMTVLALLTAALSSRLTRADEPAAREKGSV